MEDINKYLVHKKVAIRFLKDAGVYSAFKEYLNNCQKMYDKDNWYQTAYIDTIFGRLDFTNFLTRSKHIHNVFNISLDKYYISTIFRTYILINYKNMFAFKNPHKIISELPNETFFRRNA